MKKALVGRNNQVHQVAAAGQESEAEPPLYWVDCPDEVRPGTHTYDGRNFFRVQKHDPSMGNPTTGDQATGRPAPRPDAEMDVVLEDVIGVLIDKGVLALYELPKRSQDVLADRILRRSRL